MKTPLIFLTSTPPSHGDSSAIACSLRVQLRTRESAAADERLPTYAPSGAGETARHRAKARSRGSASAHRSHAARPARCGKRGAIVAAKGNGVGRALRVAEVEIMCCVTARTSSTGTPQGVSAASIHGISGGWLINSAALRRVGTSHNFARFLPGFKFAFKIVFNTWPRKKKY